MQTETIIGRGRRTAKSQTGFSWSPAASPTLYQRIDHAFISGRPPHSEAQVGSSWRLLDSDQIMSVRCAISVEALCGTDTA